MNIQRIKFFNESKGFGFTDKDVFIHMKNYRTPDQFWFGNTVQNGKEVEPPHIPAMDDEIVIVEQKETDKGVSATWCYPTDIVPRLELFIVVRRVEQVTSTEPVADNEHKVYKQTVSKEVTESIEFIGLDKDCDIYISKIGGHTSEIFKKRASCDLSGIYPYGKLISKI